MIGRVTRSADFERVLARPSCARSPHFAVHHLAAQPSPSAWVLSPSRIKLSTGDSQSAHSAVDETPLPPPALPPEGCWLGVVVPKRHAKRSVTRSLIKRQMRVAFDERQLALTPGLWVLRLRSPFDRKAFPSAASDALRAAARAELAQLMARALARLAA
jgi:ribonuclease P protein component